MRQKGGRNRYGGRGGFTETQTYSRPAVPSCADPSLSGTKPKSACCLLFITGHLPLREYSGQRHQRASNTKARRRREILTPVPCHLGIHSASSGRTGCAQGALGDQRVCCRYQEKRAQRAERQPVPLSLHRAAPSEETPLAWMQNGHVCLQGSVFRRHRSVQQHQFSGTDETTAVHLQRGYPPDQPASRRPQTPQSSTQGRITSRELIQELTSLRKIVHGNI